MNLDKLKLKIKNAEVNKWYVVIFVLLTIVVRFWGENSVTLLEKEVPIETGVEISEDEFARYIQTRQDYINDNINVSLNIIYSRDLDDYLDKDVHEWFLVRKWRPKRYFYVEDRIKLILAHIKKRQQDLAEASRLDAQAKYLLTSPMSVSGNRQNDMHQASTLKKKAEDLRYNKDKGIREAGITTKEEIIVTNQQNLLESLFDEHE